MQCQKRCSLSVMGIWEKNKILFGSGIPHSHYELLFLLLFLFVHMEKLLRGGWFDSGLMVAFVMSGWRSVGYRFS